MSCLAWTCGRFRQPKGILLMIRNKSLRRSLGALLVLLGVLLIWLPSDLISGVVLVVAGAALELVGIALEKNDKQA
jgi:drug/metabolite transporter (DMT)-like permease